MVGFKVTSLSSPAGNFVFFIFCIFYYFVNFSLN